MHRRPIPDEGCAPLPELKNDRGAAQGINRFGAIVGYSEASDGWPKAVLWRPQ